MTEGELHKPALHARHAAMQAKMADAGGWDMPLVYTSVGQEVRAVRSRAGVCDVSHGGRIRLRGEGAPDLLDRICTADAVHQEDDTALYTLLCNERGGVIDQGHLLRLEGFWVLTCSPGNRAKVLEHLRAAAGGMSVKIDDQSETTSQIAVWGPSAGKILDAVLPMQVSSLPPLAVRRGSLLVANYIAMRTSAAGLWGLEVILTNLMVGQAWRFITEKAGDNALPPVGQAAADVLRIEAGLPAYGRELNEKIDPLTAGLGAAVDFGHDFIGREALERIRDAGPARRRVGLVLEEVPSGRPAPGVIPRQGSPVKQEASEVGAVTSGAYLPTLDRIIAMAYVTPDAAEHGMNVTVETPSGAQAAKIAPLPFR